MSEFVVYGIPGSPFLRSACLGLEEKGQPYRIERLADMRGETHRSLHPFGRMPIVDHGSFRLYETQAILRYVDALFPKPALQPTEPRAIARMNQIIGINDWYLFPQAARIIVFNRIIGPALLGMRPDETAIAAAVPDARLCLGELDRLVDGQPFLAGEQLTIADSDAGATGLLSRRDARGRGDPQGYRPFVLARAHERTPQHDGDGAARSFPQSRVNAPRP